MKRTAECDGAQKREMLQILREDTWTPNLYSCQVKANSISQNAPLLTIFGQHGVLPCSCVYWLHTPGLNQRSRTLTHKDALFDLVCFLHFIMFVELCDYIKEAGTENSRAHLQYLNLAPPFLQQNMTTLPRMLPCYFLTLGHLTSAHRL